MAPGHMVSGIVFFSNWVWNRKVEGHRNLFVLFAAQPPSLARSGGTEEMCLEAEFQGTWSLYQTSPAHALSSFFFSDPSLFSFRLSRSPFLSGSLCPSVCLYLGFPVLVFFFSPSPLPARVSSLGSGDRNHAPRARGGCAARLFRDPGTRLGKGDAFLDVPGPGPGLPKSGSSSPSPPGTGRRGMASVCAGAGNGAVEGATAGDVSERESVCVCARF